MTEDQSCKFQMPFGKHIGKTLEDIALIEKDVKYLDYMIGQDLYGEVKEALETFLKIPWVSRMVSEALESQSRSGAGRTEPIENYRKPKQWWEK